jgi:CRISPR-associated protein Cas1
MPLDLHKLPKFRDGTSYLYVEHCRVEQEAKAIALHDAGGRVPVPCAGLAVLMLGPGTVITHAAIRALAENGCLVIWCGEENVRFYAQGMGETRRAVNFLHQAELWAQEKTRLQVVRRLYEMRFSEPLAAGLGLRQIRGMEGARVRDAYAHASRATGVPWHGRAYRRDDWKNADPVNRALSAANSCLYGICHAGIVSAGFCPTLGFVHTGRMTSFVYDVADLYKTETTVPVAFRTVAESIVDVERRVRYACRDAFVETRLLTRIVPDIEYALMLSDKRIGNAECDGSNVAPGNIWSPEGEVPGGVNYGEARNGSNRT